MTPSLFSLLVSHWQLAPGPDLGVALAAGLYVAASRRVRSGWPRLRTLSFMAGLATLLVAVQSGVAAYDDRMLSMHMVQHMLLLLVAPLFLIAGRPLLLALRAMPPARRPVLTRALARLRPFTGPWIGLAFFCGVLAATHLAWFYDQTLAHPLLHDVEHLLFLLAGCALIWPLLDGDPVPAHQIGGLAKLVYVLIAMLPMAVIGAYLNRHTSIVYQPYALPAHALGISALDDQAEAGAIMWVVGNTIMIGIGLWAVMASMIADERRQQGRDARLGAASAAPSREPGR
jgi:putative copper resistance protein D